MTDPSASSALPTVARPTFEAIPLSAETRASLEKMGYLHPTPVQLAVFEPASAGRDLVVQARTGTGKTTAFGLPIVEHFVRRNTANVQALCLCPTRELAVQVTAELELLGHGRNVSTVAIYGGAPMGKQIEALSAGAQVVVGTPGRVLDHLRRGTLDPSSLRVLVLDEADEMLSMGFERDLHAILDLLPKEHQTLLFSATLPADIERMAREKLRNPEFVTLSGDAVGALSIQHYVYVTTEEKNQCFLKILEVENPESAVIFCNTKIETEAVSQFLTRHGYQADWLNGDLSQAERESVMAKIKAGQLRFLVATDVAARGIDISHLTHVFNYDFPDNAEAYVHRTGRTGRAGRTGTAVSLIKAQDIGNLYLLRLTYGIRPLEKQVPSTTELRTRYEVDLVQMLLAAYASAKPAEEDLTLARRLLSHDRVEELVACLLRDRLGDRPAAQTQATAARRVQSPPVISNPATVISAEPTSVAPILAPNAVSARASTDPYVVVPGSVPRRPRRKPSEANLPLENPSLETTQVNGFKTNSSDYSQYNESDQTQGEDEQILDDSLSDLYAEIFIDIGRRDGIRPADLQKILQDTSGLSRRETGRIRVRERHSFLAVRRDRIEEAIAALMGATIGGKQLRAEPAREREEPQKIESDFSGS